MHTATITQHRDNIHTQGFTVIADVFDKSAINTIITAINAADSSGPLFRKTKDLFAIRRFLQVVPISSLIFTAPVQALLQQLFGAGYFAVKSIYFDKPGESNWFVAWHQDLTISVTAKLPIAGYGPWTVKPGQYAVQPPLDILESNFTIRIHLDDTDEYNGALKIIPGSHLEGVYRVHSMNIGTKRDVSCAVKAGGMMIMRPLLMHASGRSSNGHNRRVIHIEFSNRALAGGLEWAEKLPLLPAAEA